jgi:ABC-type amino acid transport substrate-binding protein
MPDSDARRDLARRSLLLAALAAVSLRTKAQGNADKPTVPVAFDGAAGLQQMLDVLSPGLDFSWSPLLVPWARLIAMTEQGTAIGMSIAKTQAREALLDFSEPIFKKHAWMIVRRGGAFNYRRLDDLKGRHICLRRGVSYGDEFEAAQGRKFQLDVVDTPLQARLQMVQRGRCDLTVWSSAQAEPEVAARRIAAWPELAAQLEVLPVPMVSVGVHFATRKGGPLAHWLPAIDVALRRERAVLQRLAAGSGKD